MSIGVGVGISAVAARSNNVGAAFWAPGPPPDGYHWEYVTLSGAKVTFFGQPVVASVRN